MSSEKEILALEDRRYASMTGGGLRRPRGAAAR